MTTFLSALRFAVNIETTLAALQVKRFREIGDVSTRLFPPLVPICFLPELPSEADLDAVRRTHRLDLRRNKPAAESTHAPVAGAYRLEIDGFSALRSEVSARWASATDPFRRHIATKQGTSSETATTGAGPTHDTGGCTARFASSAVYLGWSELPVQEAPPVALPDTQALWLSVFRLEYADSPQWWSDASWDLLYSRRCTNWRER